MATIHEVQNCYRYILGREMVDEEVDRLQESVDRFAAMDIHELRRSFLRSNEFHGRHLETFFENLVPQSKVVAYQTDLGFRIYLDLRQLHISFGVINEIYDRHEIEILRQIVPDDGTFFDVGANCGYYSLAVASKRGFEGRVLAFEPLLPLFQLLERSIVDNGFQARIKAYQMALGHERETMALTDAEHSINAGATELLVPGSPAKAGSRIVNVETLDRVAAGHAPDVMKIDIQGAEGLFFHGARKTLEQHKPTLMFEACPEVLHRVSGIGICDLERWLAQKGYRFWIMQPNRLAPVAPGQEFSAEVPEAGFLNILAIHAERTHEIGARLGGLP